MVYTLDFGRFGPVGPGRPLQSREPLLETDAVREPPPRSLPLRISTAFRSRSGRRGAERGHVRRRLPARNAGRGPGGGARAAAGTVSASRALPAGQTPLRARSEAALPFPFGSSAATPTPHAPLGDSRPALSTAPCGARGSPAAARTPPGWKASPPTAPPAETRGIPSSPAARQTPPAGTAGTRRLYGPAPIPAARPLSGPATHDRTRLPHTAGATEERGAARGTQRAPGTGGGSPPPRDLSSGPTRGRVRQAGRGRDANLSPRNSRSGSSRRGTLLGTRRGSGGRSLRTGFRAGLGHAGPPGPRSAAEAAATGAARPAGRRRTGSDPRRRPLPRPRGSRTRALPGAHSARLRARTGRTVPPAPAPPRRLTPPSPVPTRRGRVLRIRRKHRPPEVQLAAATAHHAHTLRRHHLRADAGPPARGPAPNGLRGASLRPQSPSGDSSRLPSPW